MQKTIGITFCCLFLSLLPLDDAHAARVALPRTGQTLCYVANGVEVDCSGTGQDGALQKGVVWPNPRFTDNIVNGFSNGTVTDNLSGLIWLKNANCIETSGGIAKASGILTWGNAITWSNNLTSGQCGLTDGSTAGQWRLPSRNELESLVDLSKSNPALPAGNHFSNTQSTSYWSGSTYVVDTADAWFVDMGGGGVSNGSRTGNGFVWPVRAGQ
jgi:hypothetical protein